MLRSCMVTGRFTRHERPVQGLVRFTPSRLWVVCDDITWACLAPEITLGRDGSFVAQLTATDCDPVPWTYLIETPAGCWEVYLPWEPNGYVLPDLIQRHGVKLAT